MFEYADDVTGFAPALAFISYADITDVIEDDLDCDSLEFICAEFDDL